MMKRKRPRVKDSELQRNLNSLLFIQATERGLEGRFGSTAERMKRRRLDVAYLSAPKLEEKKLRLTLLQLLLRRQVIRGFILKFVCRVLQKKEGFVLPNRTRMIKVAKVIETVLCARYTLALFAFGRAQLRMKVLACLKAIIAKTRREMPRGIQQSK